VLISTLRMTLWTLIRCRLRGESVVDFIGFVEEIIGSGVCLY
jgi:hypothetical protein